MHIYNKQTINLKSDNLTLLFYGIKKHLFLNTAISIVCLSGSVFLLVQINKYLNVLIILVLAILCAALVLYFLKLRQGLEKKFYSANTLSEKVNKIKEFSQMNFTKLKYISAINNPLIIIVGSFFYRYYKYSFGRYTDVKDIVVLILFLIIGYISRLIAANYVFKQFNLKIETLLVLNSVEKL